MDNGSGMKSGPGEAGEGAVEETRQVGTGGFPGGPVVRAPRSQFRGRGFDPWLGN